jgi:UDPglucose--hexose-1-phosphate uridylyltransferase
MQMPELRQNFFTKEWVIIATERAKRPEELATHRPVQQVPAFVQNCPFCAGNEDKTPPEVLRFPESTQGPWAVRVIPNKFAALSSDVQPTRNLKHLWRRIDGFGFHEVIIDGPDHSLCMALLTDAQVANILEVFKLRYSALSMDQRVAHITLFKNHGIDAGASMQHPHSQLIATPVIPSQVRHRLNEALRHYDEVGECMFCHMVESEIGEKTRVVVKSEHFVAMEVFASATPFATHIFPLRHMASFGDISTLEIADLARVLRTMLAKIYVGLENPDLNFTVRSGPAEYAGVRHFHWYISVIPRLTRTAGFELGSGMFINTVLPEAAAEFLRNVAVDKAQGAKAGG